MAMRNWHSKYDSELLWVEPRVARSPGRRLASLKIEVLRAQCNPARATILCPAADIGEREALQFCLSSERTASDGLLPYGRGACQRSVYERLAFMIALLQN
jgi:hypothetical protein